MSANREIDLLVIEILKAVAPVIHGHSMLLVGEAMVHACAELVRVCAKDTQKAEAVRAAAALMETLANE